MGSSNMNSVLEYTPCLARDPKDTERIAWFDLEALTPKLLDD
jgi:hypothetical protein